MKKVQAKKLYKTIEEVYIAHGKKEVIPRLRSLRGNWSIVSEQIVHFAINEISTLLNSARHESEQKKLPEALVEKSTDELYLIWELINSWWESIDGLEFIAPDIQQLPHKDKDSFYNALVDLYYQGRIAGRCYNIMEKRGDKRFGQYPIGLSMLAMMESQEWEEEGYTTESYSIEKKGAKKMYKYVNAVARQRGIPSRDREQKVQNVIGDLSNKMRTTPYHKRLERYFYTPENISDAFTDAYHYQKADKRTPPGGDELSLDELIETDNGKKIPRIDTIPAPQTQQTPFEIEFNDYQKDALKEYFKEEELEILEFIIDKPDDTQEEIAQKARRSQGEVSKTKSKYKKYESQIRKILGFPEKK